MPSVFVIAAHPDDEVLGCGGTISKLTNQGITVNILFLSNGVGSRDKLLIADPVEIESRQKAAKIACKILGAELPGFGEFPDNQFDTVPLLQITEKIEELIEFYNPDTVFTHHAGDLNIDHQRTHQAVITACRPQRGHPVKKLLFFEIPSSTEWQCPGSGSLFSPNWFEDITPYLKAKLEALSAYEYEMREPPHPRSMEGVETLARWRGATVGMFAAEAFMLGRYLG